MGRKEKFIELFSEEWYSFLKDFLLSEEFEYIAKVLKKEILEGLQLVPDFKNMFRAFKECPKSKLHTIILGMDPYPYVNRDGSLVADGLAFSSRTSQQCPRSLEEIYNAIDMGIYEGSNFDLRNTNDLVAWANQGILLLNTSLSTVVGKSAVHTELWKPFIRFILRRINENFNCLGFVLLGANAKAFKPLLTNTTFTILDCEHPFAVVNHGGKWKHENVFARLTAYQNFANNIKINWNAGRN